MNLSFDSNKKEQLLDDIYKELAYRDILINLYGKKNQITKILIVI